MQLCFRVGFEGDKERCQPGIKGLLSTLQTEKKKLNTSLGNVEFNRVKAELNGIHEAGMLGQCISLIPLFYEKEEELQTGLFRKLMLPERQPRGRLAEAGSQSPSITNSMNLGLLSVSQPYLHSSTLGGLKRKKKKTDSVGRLGRQLSRRALHSEALGCNVQNLIKLHIIVCVCHPRAPTVMWEVVIEKSPQSLNLNLAYVATDKSPCLK